MKIKNIQMSQQISKVSFDKVTLNRDTNKLDDGDHSHIRKMFKDNSGNLQDRHGESVTQLKSNSQIFSQKNLNIIPVQSMLNQYPDQRSSPSGRSNNNSPNEMMQAISSIPYIGKELPSITTKKDAPFAQPRYLNNANQTLQHFSPKKDKSQRRNKMMQNAPSVTQKLTYFNSTIKTDTIYEENNGEQQNQYLPVPQFKKDSVNHLSSKVNSPMGRDNRTYKTINTYYNKGTKKQKKTIQKDDSKHSEIMQKLSIRDMKTKINQQSGAAISNPAASLDQLIHEIDVYANDFILDKMQNKTSNNESSNGKNWTSFDTKKHHHITVKNKGNKSNNNTSLQNSRDSSVISTNQHKKLDKNFPNISFSTQSGSWYPNVNRAKINNTELVSSISKPMRQTNQSNLFHILEDSQSIEQDNNFNLKSDMNDDSAEDLGTFHVEKKNEKMPKKKNKWLSNTRAETMIANTPEHKMSVPSKKDKLRGSHKTGPLIVELDYEKLTNKEKILQLPSVIKTSKTAKNEDNKKKQYDFKLPKNFKFTNDPNYQNLEAMRQRMRKNRIEHNNFSAVIGSSEGKKYYNEDVYKLNQPTYVTIDVSEVDRKNKLLHYTKSLYERDPNEIDLLKDKEEQDKKDRKNQQEVDSMYFSDEEEQEKYEEMKRKKREEETYESETVSSEGPNEDDLEVNLFKKVLKNGPPQNLPTIQSSNIKGAPKPVFTEKKTTEQIDREKMFQRELERTVAENLCKEFQSQMVKTDTGELKINLGRSSEIEQKLKEVGSLKKFVPPNYSGSLREFVKEANEMMEAGFELDHAYIKMITTRPFDELWKEKRQKKAADEKRRKERRFRRQDTIESENSYIKGLKTLRKSSIEEQVERDQDATLAKVHKIRQGLEELSKTKKYQAAAAKFDDAYIQKLALQHSVEQALAIIQRAVESVDVEDSDDSSYKRKQAKPTFSKMRILPKLAAYNDRQKKHNPHLYDEEGNLKSEGRESQMLKSVIDTVNTPHASGRGPAILNDRRGSSMSIDTKRGPSIKSSSRNLQAMQQDSKTSQFAPQSSPKLQKMKSQLQDPTLMQMLDGIQMLSNSELSDASESRGKSIKPAPFIDTSFQVRSPDLFQDVQRSPFIKQTKTSKLRRAVNLIAENQIHEQFSQQFSNKMREMSKQKHELRKAEIKEYEKKMAMRQNHLKNSLTFGVSNKVSVKNQCTHNLVQKAMAIQNLIKQNKSQQSMLNSPNGFTLKNNINRSLDLNSLIQKSVSPKVQLEIKFNESLQLKQRMSINKDKAQLSVDITKNRKINEIKNMLKNPDHDEFIKYDQPEEPKLKKGKMMRNVSGRSSLVISPDKSQKDMSNSNRSMPKYEESSSSRDSILHATIKEDVKENESSFGTDTGTDIVNYNSLDEDSSINDQFNDQNLMDMARQMNSTQKYGSPDRKNSSLQLLKKKFTMKAKPKYDESLTKSLSFISKHRDTSKPFTAEEIKNMRLKLRRVGSKLNTNLDSILQQIEDKKEEMIQKKLRATKNQARSYQNRKNLTVIMRSIERQFQDKGWVEKTEPKRDKVIKGIEIEENRLKSCIESYTYLMHKATSDKDVKMLTEEDLEELMPQIDEILRESKEKDQYDFENFLSPKIISLYQEINTRNAQKTQQFQNNQAPTIWKPNKLKLNYDIFEEEKKV